MQNKRFFKIIMALVLIMLGAGILAYTYLNSAGAVVNDAPVFQPLSLPAEAEAPFAALFGRADRATEYKTLPAKTFKTLAGDDKTFADFKGVPTLVNFWATWCPPCVVELPSLQKLEKHYAGRMNVVAIALEYGRPPGELAKFLEDRQIGEFAAFQDFSGAMTTGLKLRGLPTTFLLGSGGEILYRFEGDADWTSPEAKVFFDAFLLQKR
jgi:thiol-disulfide isomerase/thioredoxin